MATNPAKKTRKGGLEESKGTAGSRSPSDPSFWWEFSNGSTSVFVDQAWTTWRKLPADFPNESLLQEISPLFHELFLTCRSSPKHIFLPPKKYTQRNWYGIFHPTICGCFRKGYFWVNCSTNDERNGTPADMEERPLLNWLAGISPATMFHHTPNKLLEHFASYSAYPRKTSPPRNMALWRTWQKTI